MMTSVVSNPTRGPRDRALPTTTQTTQPQKQIQATAEQIRLAQMIYDKNDADFEDKVKQLIEVSGKTQDECMVALHDCNEDVNRAINFLLESPSDAVRSSWETVGKKRGLVKEGGPEIKEKRGGERGGERDASRGRGGSNRRGRGASRTREVRAEENGFEMGLGERGGDRGRRGRGRAVGGRGRGRAAGGARFTNQGMGIFNPAEYGGGPRQDTWDTEGNEAEGTYRGNLEDWAGEDWNEDLSETKVFTASSPANHITPGNGVDVSSLLPKPGPGGAEAELAGLDVPSEGLGQSMVFTNSHINGRPATHSYAHAASNSYAHAASASSTYAHAALSSGLGSGFGSLSSPKPAPSDARLPEQLNRPHLSLRTNQPPVAAGNAKESVPPAVQSSAPISSSELKAPRVENGPVTTSHMDLKMQPEPSAVLSQLAARHQASLAASEPPALVPTPPGHEASLAPPRDGPSPAEAPITEPPRLMKTQRRRVAPSSKIPFSAVEMPGSADVSGLNVQFGALDFGSEPGVAELGPSEPAREVSPAPASTPLQQPQSSLFSKPGAGSDPLGSMPTLPPAVSDPIFPSPSLGLPSATPSPSMGLPSAAPQASSAQASVPRSLPPHLGYPQSKDPSQPGALSNGYSGVRTQSTHEAPSASRTPKPESPPMTSDSVQTHHVPGPAHHIPGPAHHIPGPAHHIPGPAPTSHSAPLPSLSSHVTSSHSGQSLSTSSALTMTSEESNAGLLAAFSSAGPAIIPSSAPISSSSSNGMHMSSGAPGLTANGSGALSAGRSAPLLNATSGKAPPNLAQGVPPLLANQYIMGPGGLLPAYPQIYGYEDLQMLQSRLPMDYYGVTFPGNAAAMPGRDGLANNPYSGEATKFGRADASSPAPPTSLSGAGPSQQQQAPQGGGQGQSQQQSQNQQTQNQAFLNPPLPPGYGYTGLPYYAGMPGVPSAFQYGPTVFVPPTSAKQPGMGLGNPSSQYHQQHQPNYGQHQYTTAFDDLSQGHAGEYSKGGYGGSVQSQVKSAGNGPGKAPGLSGSGNSGGVPDMGASIYSKNQSFDKQGFHTGTPPPFSLPSALGGSGQLNPGGAPGYAPAPFLHILPPHQQPHSQLLHHHMAQDGQGGQGQRSQSSGMQQKSQGKSGYGSSPYWAN